MMVSETFNRLQATIENDDSGGTATRGALREVPRDFDINEVDSDGWTLLHVAVDVEIDASVQLDYYPPRAGSSRWLIEAGADPDIRDPLGVSARSMGEARGGHPEFLALLDVE